MLAMHILCFGLHLVFRFVLLPFPSCAFTAALLALTLNSIVVYLALSFFLNNFILLLFDFQVQS